MKILIVGAGIGGMTAAIALARDGHTVTLAERAQRLSPLGAGIVLAPNAVRVLQALGVDLANEGELIRAMHVVDERGVRLQSIDTLAMGEIYGPTYAVQRPVLSSALCAALPPGVEWLLGAEIASLAQRGDEVEVAVDGALRRFDLALGADGLHSFVRQQVVGAWPVRYSGVTCWRGIASNPGFTSAVEAWGGAARIGVVPLRDNLLYYFLVLSAPRRAPALQWPEGFARAFGHLEAAVPGLLAALPEPPPLHHDLEELDTPVWGRGRVLLLGDAAHAMTPNQGQGAAMAIEDAWTLALLLRDGTSDLLLRYQSQRHKRVRAVQIDSRRIGKFAHWQNGFACWLRNALVRALPRAVGDRQYRRVVEPGLALISPSQHRSVRAH